MKAEKKTPKVEAVVTVTMTESDARAVMDAIVTKVPFWQFPTVRDLYVALEDEIGEAEDY